MNVPFVDLRSDYQAHHRAIDNAIAGVLERCDFVLGQTVHDFESAFADYCEAGYAVGVDSGYSALELILRAYGIGPGDEVITVANTFIATALAISNCGAVPVLVDADAQSYNLDPGKLEAALSARTKAILPVHLYGQPADMDPILAFARRHNLRVIEDACQAHGARYKGKRAGSLGDAAAFSFYPSKNLGAYGDAGIVVTGDAQLAEKVRALANLGQIVRYHHDVKGFNHRLDTVQAAVLHAKLAWLDEANAARRTIARIYDRLLGHLPLQTPLVQEGLEAVFHLYVIQVDERDALQQHLAGCGIATGIHYPVPIHLQQAYQELNYREGDFPVTERAAKRILSLPMYPMMTSNQITYTVDAIAAFFDARSHF